MVLFLVFTTRDEVDLNLLGVYQFTRSRSETIYQLAFSSLHMLTRLLEKYKQLFNICFYDAFDFRYFQITKRKKCGAKNQLVNELSSIFFKS